LGLVIDTSAFVAVERASASWEAGLSTLGDEPAALPAIVCAELLVGAHLARGAARAASRRAKIHGLLARIPVVDFGLAIAERWAELFTTLSRQGRLIPPTIWPWRRPRFISASESSSVRRTRPTSAWCPA
jgi:predicted nucleic acid-binding protein